MIMRSCPKIDGVDRKYFIKRLVVEWKPAAISEADVSAALYTRDIPDPDLLIRTSGEMRVSNFLLWQIAYTELWITPTLWPDFGARDLYRALVDFQGRTRRFGGV